VRRPELSWDDPPAEDAEEEAGLQVTRAPREPTPLTVADVADHAVSVPTIRTLLAGAIDYAGLFPPASLSMDEAVRNYASYRAAADSWALGRFVVPMTRLGEFRECAASVLSAESPWRLAALAGAGGDDWHGVEHVGHHGAVVDALELRARTPDDVRAAASRRATDLDVFYEIPIDSDPGPLVAAIARVGGKAKVRTGGVTAEAFPNPADLARFVVTCARAAVPFKATAGLHHALRATYCLTYDADSPRSEMFGFLNVLLAAAFARAGLGTQDVTDVLAESDAAALRFGSDVVEWRGRRVSMEVLAETRGALAPSFGSCSFTEPIEELEALGLL
jgi:hypothetical protein